MKRISYTAIILLALVSITGACSESIWEQLPTTLSRFIEQYFPGATLGSYDETPDGAYTVTLDDGATIVFDDNMEWTSVDGNGAALPSVLLYDQLPARLFNYLQETEQTDRGYTMTRVKSVYTVSLLEGNTVSFDTVTGRLFGSGI